MANNATTYLSNKLLDHSLGTATFTKPTTVYLALYTVAGSASARGTEVTGGSYARVAVTLNAASAQSASLASSVVFPTATADWGTVVEVGIEDALTVGNQLWRGSLTSNRNITNGTTYTHSTLTVGLT